MDKAEVIRPELRKSRCRCSLCNLTYTPKQYRLLYDLKKVIYFSYLPPNLKRHKIVCHACLMPLIKMHRKSDLKISVKIMDKAKESSWRCYSYANDVEDSVLDLSFFP